MIQPGDGFVPAEQDKVISQDTNEANDSDTDEKSKEQETLMMLD